MANIVRGNGQLGELEAKRQYAGAANTLARIVTDIEDLNEEEKKIREAIRRDEAKRLARLKEISALKKLKREQQSEAVGAYKMLIGLLKKLKVDAPRTQLKEEHAHELVGQN